MTGLYVQIMSKVQETPYSAPELRHEAKVTMTNLKMQV